MDKAQLSRAGKGENRHDGLAKKILDNLTDKYQGKSITPSAYHIFKVNDTACKLSEKEAKENHTIVEKLIFIRKREQPDILTKMDFLTTQVRDPNDTTARNCRVY